VAGLRPVTFVIVTIAFRCALSLMYLGLASALNVMGGYTGYISLGHTGLELTGVTAGCGGHDVLRGVSLDSRSRALVFDTIRVLNADRYLAWARVAP
jgi:hypothetical protein